MDLAEFAQTDEARAERNARHQAWITTLPEYDQILDYWVGGGTIETIRNWLVHKRGYPRSEVTFNRVRWLKEHVEQKEPTDGE